MSGLKGYFVHDIWVYSGVAVVAHTVIEAKMIGFNSVQNSHGSGWVDVAAKWIRNVDVSGLENPEELSLIDGLRRGILGSVDDIDCEICGKKGTLCECHDGKIVCLDCHEKLIQGVRE